MAVLSLTAHGLLSHMHVITMLISWKGSDVQEVRSLPFFWYRSFLFSWTQKHCSPIASILNRAPKHVFVSLLMPIRGGRGTVYCQREKVAVNANAVNVCIHAVVKRYDSNEQPTRTDTLGNSEIHTNWALQS